jgi:hypothetical protein
LIGPLRGEGKYNFVGLGGGETFLQVTVPVELFTQRGPVIVRLPPMNTPNPEAFLGIGWVTRIFITSFVCLANQKSVGHEHPPLGYDHAGLLR